MRPRVASMTVIAILLFTVFQSATSVNEDQKTVANATGPYEGLEGSPITFNATGALDHEDETIQYRWDFDDDGLWDTNWSSDPMATYTWGDDYSGEIAFQTMTAGDEKEDINAEGDYIWFSAVNWMGENGQSFVPNEKTLSKIAVDVRVSYGTPNGDLLLYVRERIDGPNLTHASIPPDELPRNPYTPPEDWPVFDFPDIEVEIGEEYYFVITSPVTAGGNYEIHLSNDTYANGTAYYHELGKNWEMKTGRDLRFRTYTSEIILSEPVHMPVTVRNLDPAIENLEYTVHENQPRTQGFWRFPCHHENLPPPDHLDIQEEFITEIRGNSKVFMDLKSKQEVCAILEPSERSSMKDKAKQQLMALWLNVVSGRLHLNSSVNLSELTPSSNLGDVIDEVEDVVSNSAGKEDLERAKDISDSINNGIGVPAAFLIVDTTGSDIGSDDLSVNWNWGDGTSTSAIYYNDGIGPDPYPSPDINSISVTDTQKHDFFDGGFHTILLTMEDDDGGSVTRIFEFTTP